MFTSLLLVDIMQKIGPEFELLLASHKGIYLDVGSGNMMDSGLVSPDYPFDQNVPLPSLGSNNGWFFVITLTRIRCFFTEYKSV